MLLAESARASEVNSGLPRERTQENLASAVDNLATAAHQIRRHDQYCQWGNEWRLGPWISSLVCLATNADVRPFAIQEIVPNLEAIDRV